MKITSLCGVLWCVVVDLRGLLLGVATCLGVKGAPSIVPSTKFPCRARSVSCCGPMSLCISNWTDANLKYAIVVVALVWLVIWLVVSFADVFMECSDELCHSLSGEGLCLLLFA